MQKIIDSFINEISNKKGEDILYVNTLENPHPMAEYILVVSALNQIHIKALEKTIVSHYKNNKQDISKECDYFGTSGKSESEWVIIDLNPVIIHVMSKTIRSSYEFDNLFEKYEQYRFH